MLSIRLSREVVGQSSLDTDTMTTSASEIYKFIMAYVAQSSLTDRSSAGMTGEKRVGSNFLIGLTVHAEKQTVQLDIIKAYHIRELRPVHQTVLNSLGFPPNGPGLEFSFTNLETVHAYSEITSHFCDALLSLEEGLKKLIIEEDNK